LYHNISPVSSPLLSPVPDCLQLENTEGEGLVDLIMCSDVC